MELLRARAARPYNLYLKDFILRLRTPKGDAARAPTLSAILNAFILQSAIRNPHSAFLYRFPHLHFGLQGLVFFQHPLLDLLDQIRGQVTEPALSLQVVLDGPQLGEVDRSSCTCPAPLHTGERPRSPRPASRSGWPGRKGSSIPSGRSKGCGCRMGPESTWPSPPSP